MISALGIRTPAGALDTAISVLLGPVRDSWPKDCKREELSWATKSRVVLLHAAMARTGDWLPFGGESGSSSGPRCWVGGWGYESTGATVVIT